MTEDTRIKQPQQDRSRETLERVMEAGLEVLAEDGWKGFTIARACERAGVSVGMPYRRFRGRDDMLAALQDRWMDAVERDLAEITGRPVDWGALEPAQAVRVALESMVEGMRRQETLTRVIGLHGTLDDAGFARMAGISQGYARWFRESLAHHAGAVRHARPASAVDFAFRIAIDTTIRRSTHGDDFDTGEPIGDWETFTEELWSAACAYLFRPERPTG